MSIKLCSEGNIQCRKGTEKSNTTNTVKLSGNSSIKNVDLSLEVEMGDSVKDIITSPEKYRSALLDVTVLKEKNFDSLYAIETTTLNTAELKDFLASMEIEKQFKKKLINQILKQKLSKTTLNHLLKKKFKSEFDLSTADELSHKLTKLSLSKLRPQKSFHEFSDYEYKKQEEKKRRKLRKVTDDRIEQVYASPRGYHDVRSIFACKNKHNLDGSEKAEEPCSCKNCAILGIIQDSQKRPYLVEPSAQKESKKLHKHDKTPRKKSVTWKYKDGAKEDEHAECKYYFKYLSTKIKVLEERLAKHEEKTVAKDYFKRIITKLVSHIGKIAVQSHEDVKDPHHSYAEPKRKFKEKSGSYSNKYTVNPVLLPDLKPVRLQEETENDSKLLHVNYSANSFWKWGEEVLKPGVDLKNKIQAMLEQSLNAFKKDLETQQQQTEHVCAEQQTTRESMKHFQNIPTEHIDKMEVESSLPTTRTHNKNNPACSDIRLTNSDSSIFLKRTMYKNEKRRRRGGVASKAYSNRVKEFSYFSNNSLQARDSDVSFKIDMSENEVASRMKKGKDNVNNEAYKQEFLRTLANTKDADKEKLWQSIWKQAMINGQTKDDKVTIQIPRFKDRNNKPMEIHYTIAELEALLKKKDGKKNNKNDKQKYTDRKRRYK